MSAPPSVPSAPPAPPTIAMPPVPPGQFPPQWAPPPPPGGQPKKSNTGLIVGIIAAVVVLLCGGGIGAFFLIRNAMDNVENVLPSFTVPVNPSNSPSDEPIATDDPTDDPAPTGETFNMALGDGVEVSQTDGTVWTVYVLGAEWFAEPCTDFGTAENPIVVLDVEFEVVSGTASVNPLFDFEYIADGGGTADSSLFSFCDEPALTDTFDRTAGDIVTGKIAFEVANGSAGRLEYSSDFELTASWLIPAQG